MGEDKNTKFLSFHLIPSLLKQYTDATFVIVYLLPQRQYKMCVNLCEPYSTLYRNLMYENRMLGVPRIRQLRTSNSSCSVHKDFKKAIKRCHAPYSYSTEDTSGPNISFQCLGSRSAGSGSFLAHNSCLADP